MPLFCSVAARSKLTQMLTIVDYVMEMTSEKSCECEEYGSYEHLLLLCAQFSTDHGELQCYAVWGLIHFHIDDEIFKERILWLIDNKENNGGLAI